jgi:hypothetical protein
MYLNIEDSKMPVKNDGDLIRGVGYVAVYAAYVEEAIEEVIKVILGSDSTADSNILKQQVSKQIKFIKDWLKEKNLLGGLFQGFDQYLDYVKTLMERRNEIIHGRIYAVPGSVDILKPARPGMPERKSDAAELYDLANDLYEMLAPLNTVSMFRLARHIQEYEQISD